MATFEYLRLSLAKPLQSQMFGSDGQPFKDEDRRTYLETVFTADRIDFQYYRKNYSFVRVGQFDDVLVGRIGKQSLEPHHRGPEEEFAVRMVEEWTPVWAFIDFSSRSQLIVLQKGLGSSRSLMQALFKRIEASRSDVQYVSFIEYVSVRSEFWAAVDEYAGKLTRLEFTFVPPNALGLSEKIRSIVEAAKAVGAETTKFVHSNPHAGLLPKHGEYVEAALSVTADGAGSVQLKAGRKTVFSSEKNRRTADLPNEEVPETRDDAAIAHMIEALRIKGDQE